MSRRRYAGSSFRSSDIPEESSIQGVCPRCKRPGAHRLFGTLVICRFTDCNAQFDTRYRLWKQQNDPVSREAADLEAPSGSEGDSSGESSEPTSEGASVEGS